MKPLIFFKISCKKQNYLDIRADFFSDEFSIKNENNFIYFEKKIFFHKKKIISDFEIYCFGTPIIKNKIDFENSISLVADFLKTNNDASIKDINGQFLFFCNNPKTNEIIIINDRFNGIPLYYFMSRDGNLICSNLYYNLIDYINQNNEVKFDNVKILEFLWMNKLMGDEKL